MLSSYRDLKAWQEGMGLAEACYKAVRTLPKSEAFILGDQIRRAATSIPANIAEGYGRGTMRDYLRFLYIAQGSLKELETHLLLSERLGLLSHQILAPIMEQTDRLGRILKGLCRALEARTTTPDPHHKPSGPSAQRPTPDTLPPTPS